MGAVPRIGENVKFKNNEMGDYFAFTIIDVTHREDGSIEVMTDLLDNVDDRMYSFDEESELDEYYKSYLREGWVSDRGIGPNARYKGT